jgi:hypothetical protein
MAELVEHVEHPISASIVGAILDGFAKWFAKCNRTRGRNRGLIGQLWAIPP